MTRIIDVGVLGVIDHGQESHIEVNSYCEGVGRPKKQQEHQDVPTGNVTALCQNTMTT